MNRRGFIGAMLGVAAATALPSEVWPFRKIFLPPVEPSIDVAFPTPWLAVDWTTVDAINFAYFGISRSPYPGRFINLERSETIEQVMQSSEQNARRFLHQMKESHNELLRKFVP